MSAVGRVYKLLRTVMPVIAPVITVLALGGVFSVELGTIRDLVLRAAPKLWSVRAAWLVLAALAAYFTYQEYARRGIVLTNVDLEMTLELEKPDGSQATMNRRQRIRAHREDVTGYLRKVGATGTIPRDRFVSYIDHCSEEKQGQRFSQMPNGGWELIHTFEDPIPLDVLGLGLKTATRIEKFVALNSFMEEEESYEIEIPSEYRYRKISFTLRFHPDRPRAVHECTAIRINANGVIKIATTPVLDVPGEGVRLTIKRPRAGDRYRLTWKHLPQAPTTGQASAGAA